MGGRSVIPWIRPTPPFHRYAWAEPEAGRFWISLQFTGVRESFLGSHTVRERLA